MGLIDGLKNGKYEYSQNPTGNINITTGNGNNNINVSAGNANISTGNGNQTINANITNNLSINTGTVGNDYINASANSAFINTYESDDTIKFSGNSFDINALDGNKVVVVTGNVNDTTHQNSIDLGNGTLNQVRVTANNVDITNGDGALQLGFIGNNVDVEAGNGTHTIGFWGSNVDINLGNGNNTIETLDFSLANDRFTDFGADKVLESLTTVSSKVLGSETTSSTFNAKDAIAKQYNLSAQEVAILNTIDLDAKYKDGNSLYILVRSPQKSKAAGKDVYVIAKRDGTNHSRAVSDNECIAAGDLANRTVTGTETTTQKVTTEYTYFLNGISNVNINAGDGNNNIFLTSDVKPNSNINIDLGDASTGNNILVRNGFTVKDIDTETKTSTNTKTGTVYASGTNSWNSPIVVDFNKDGQVSAMAGIGVDIDGNGIADGAAINGDKMLAMSDINGNANIDGQEVFGDQTVSPFSKQKLNAANGFEALKLIAEEAKEYTGIDCMKNGSVDLQALNQALATVGIKLGFISGYNTSEVEDLGDVAAINVENYKETEATGDVQHRQLGSYTDSEGNTYKADDVWFKAQTEQTQPSFIDLLKKIVK